jgi:hypothetical protein
MSERCTCTFCKNYDKYRWAVIMECGCGCHSSSGIDGHDGLCCEFPNGKKKDNPYKKLKSKAFYEKILKKWEEDCYKDFPENMK